MNRRGRAPMASFQSQLLRGEQFVPTQFSSAAEKAAFGNELLAFIASDFEERRFTRKLYDRSTRPSGSLPGTIGRASGPSISPARPISCASSGR
jgi:hypothetical protein